MKLVNLTPHEIRLFATSEEGDTYPIATFPSEGVARVKETRYVLAHLTAETPGAELIPINTVYMEVESASGLPDAEEGTYLLVSRVVAEAYPHRSDLLIPDESVRDEAGRIIGCRAFATPAHPIYEEDEEW